MIRQKTQSAGSQNGKRVCRWFVLGCLLLSSLTPIFAQEFDSWKLKQQNNDSAAPLSQLLNSELGQQQDRKKTRLHRYRVEIDKSLSRAKVEICFAGNAPKYLMVDYRKAVKYLLQFPKTSGGDIEFLGRYWHTEFLKKDSCVDYVSDLSPYRQSKINKNNKDKQLLFISDNNWLWLPEKLASDEQILLEINLPKGMQMSAPWYRVKDKKNWFVPFANPHQWGFGMVIGAFDNSAIRLKDGSQINLAVLDGVKQQLQLKKWVRDSAQSLANYLGRFPVTQAQVVLIQSRRFRGGPVPWGEVKRGGGLGVYFVVNSQLEIEQFYQDWTASHEFSHLLLPKIEYQDSWLSEGLASYLQYILMARSGQISAQKAWQELLEGFERGVQGTQNSPTEKLKETVDNRSRGGRSGRTMRIYWSGAAYFFKADIALRHQTSNQMTLADVLSRLNRCCAESGEIWHGRKLAETLDKLAGENIFTPLFITMSESTDFPELSTEYKDLGIHWDKGHAQYNAGKKNIIRDSIMSPFKSLQ